MFLNFFLIPMLATLVFVAALYACAEKVGFTDKPCHRKQHKKPTPLIGGLAIYLSLLATLLLNDHPLPHQTAFISAATLLICVGLIDDYKGLGVKLRLIAQIAAGLVMTQAADIKIDSLGDLFGFGEIQLGIFGTAFTVFAVVGGINAFNMIDGMDGLAGSLSLVSIATLAGVSWMSHDDALLSFCLIFMAALIVFLSLNLRIFGRPNAKIFLGDSGSTLLGFTICWLAIVASQGEKSLIAPVSVLWITAVPLVDSVCIMLRRLRKGRSPFNPDREHLHHIFYVAGYSNNTTLALLLSFSLLLAIVGATAGRYFGVPEPILFWSFMSLFTVHYELMNHAWKIMKISRYLHSTKASDRRVEDRGKTEDQRSGSDRRHIPSELELKKFHSFSDGFLKRSNDRHSRKNATGAKK
jgi:UDP-GlcNAc:undecaprenyl-phosphate/decaprenyl-phosphate GlcNAc-1-phosphate transferase